jgi:hypothetical protein
VPDYTITDGRTKIDGDKVLFNGHKFTHLLFLYPKYAKKGVYEFLNNAYKSNVKMAVIGKGEMDFDADKTELLAPQFEELTDSVLEDINCPKSAIDGGCVYVDGSFSLVSDGLLTNQSTEFEFNLDGVKYSGVHTGLLAYRKGKFAFATRGSKLMADGKEIELEYKD